MRNKGPLIAFVLSLLALPTVVLVHGINARRRHQLECRFYLPRLYAAQRALYQREKRYTERLSELDFTIERGNRYAHLLGTRGPFEVRADHMDPDEPQATGILVDTAEDHEGRLPGSAFSASYASAIPRLAGGAVPGVSGTCPDCEFTAVCIGQADRDDTLDVWSISSRERPGPRGVIPAGVAYNDVDDLRLLHLF